MEDLRMPLEIVVIMIRDPGWCSVHFAPGILDDTLFPSALGVLVEDLCVPVLGVLAATMYVLKHWVPIQWPGQLQLMVSVVCSTQASCCQLGSGQHLCFSQHPASINFWFLISGPAHSSFWAAVAFCGGATASPCLLLANLQHQSLLVLSFKSGTELNKI